LGGYFHEDWQRDDPTPQDVIRRFGELESKERASEVVKEIDALMAAGLSETELRDFVLDEMGSSYDPEADHFSTVEWLRQTRDFLAAQ
jgi:hypothetical protein